MLIGFRQPKTKDDMKTNAQLDSSAPTLANTMLADGFFKGFDLVTDPKNGFPKIGWEKLDGGDKYDYSTRFELFGYSHCGRVFSGSASWSFEELDSTPFDSEIVQVCGNCRKKINFTPYSRCSKCLDEATGHSGGGNF
jgi:hypothetical protein